MFLYLKNILVVKTAHLIGCSIGKCQISCFVSLTEKLSLASLSFGLYLHKTHEFSTMVSLKQRHRLTKRQSRTKLLKFSLEHRKHNYDKYVFVVPFRIVDTLCIHFASKLRKLKIDGSLYFKRLTCIVLHVKLLMIILIKIDFQ
jgi:hypothetical protein